MVHKSLKTLLIGAVLIGASPAWAQQAAPAAQEHAQPGFSDVGLARLDAAMQGYVDEGKLAGSVVQVRHGGQVVYERAFGWRDREAEDAMAVDDMFRIASQSKAIVSAAIMILQDEGALTIQDPLSDYLPEWADVQVAVEDGEGGYTLEPVKTPITVRHLLTHTAGVDYGRQGPAAELWDEAGLSSWYLIEREETIRDVVAKMAELPLYDHPGEAWIYGYSTDILGAVVEAASGMSLDAYLRSRIFDPLGMDDTHFFVPEDKADRLAVVYSARQDSEAARAPDEGTMVSQGHYLDGPRSVFSGGAGLVSTAEDYGRFLQMILNHGTLDGVRIMSRKSVELMTVDHLGDIPFNPGVGFGLGFSVLEDLGARGQMGAVGELGWGGAYHSNYWIDPEEELVVVYLTQLIPAGNVDDIAKLRTLIYSALE